VAQRGARQPEVRIDVRLERRVEFLVRDFVERRLAVLVRGVRNEDIELAKLSDSFFSSPTPSWCCAGNGGFGSRIGESWRCCEFFMTPPV